MRAIVWLVLLFGVAVVAALTLGDNHGLASFYWNGWRLDLSLNFFVLTAVVVGFVVVSAVHAVNALVGLPARAHSWRTLRRERAAQAALREAWSEFFAGRFSRANKAAQQAIHVHDEVDTLKDDSEFRQLAQLVAAGSLHRLQDRARRDEQLQAALRPSRKGGGGAVDDGARLLAIEWALDDRDEPRADALLAELPAGLARRTQALRLKLKAQRMALRPLEALHTARLLSKHQAFSATAAQGLLRSLACEALDAAHDIEQLRRCWQQFDPSDQRDPFVAGRAARRAAALGAADEGRQWLRPLWDDLAKLDDDARTEVALALMAATAGVGADWLPRVEAAQRLFGTDAAVQAAAGVVLVERQLWGKARRPLELAAADALLLPRARRQAWRALARLALEEGDEARAAECYRLAAQTD